MKEFAHLVKHASTHVTSFVPPLLVPTRFLPPRRKRAANGLGSSTPISRIWIFRTTASRWCLRPSPNWPPSPSSTWATMKASSNSHRKWGCLASCGISISREYRRWVSWAIDRGVRGWLLLLTDFLDAPSHLYMWSVRRSVCPVLFSKVKITHTRRILCRVSGLVRCNYAEWVCPSHVIFKQRIWPFLKVTSPGGQ